LNLVVLAESAIFAEKPGRMTNCIKKQQIFAFLA